MSVALGIDIGGTKTAFAVVDAGGGVLDSRRIETPVAAGFDATVTQIAQVAAELLQAHPAIAGIGVGSPGYVDAQAGVVVMARNLKWQDAPLKASLAAALPDVPIVIDNDVNALAIGEMYFDRTQSIGSDVLYIAAGTGLAGAIIADGRLIHGAGNVAAEVGQVRIPAGWGYTGVGTHVEDVISGTGLANVAAWLRQQDNAPATTLPAAADAKAILAAAQQEDVLAIQSLNTFTGWLNEMVTWLAAALNPSDIIIGGGFGMAAAPWIIPALREHLLQAAPHLHPNLSASQLTDTAVGAAAMVFASPAG
ncbi:MAG: ROK family protein [Chloroflexota bacterium]